MKIYLYSTLILLVLSCSSQEKKSSSFDWRKASQKLAQDYGNSVGVLYPESISSIGFTRFDAETTPYSRDLEQKRYALAYKWRSHLERFKEDVTHPELKADVEILREVTKLEMEEIELSREKGIVPFLPLTEFIHSSLTGLVKEGSSKPKIQSAMSRFRTYVRGSDEKLPLKDGYMAYLLNRLDQLKENRKRGFWPTRTEILTYLDESGEYLKGIESVLKVWAEKDWRRDFEELKLQDQSYRDFLRKKILPYCRESNHTPRDIYAFMLKGYGVFDSPERLIQVGRSDYQETFKMYQALGRALAAKYTLKSEHPVEVVKFLSGRMITDEKKLLEYYQHTADYLLGLVKKHDLLTIRNNPDYVIRFGSDAEMQSIPAPHFNSAALIGNDKSPGQYIIPKPQGSKGIPDFSFKEAIVNLTSHEGTPGHALQYQSMKERGTTLIRASFAFNSANVEGWAHYAEEIVYPYLTQEEQFMTLQRRLWRQARMFLDPELNLGKISSRDVLNLYTKELGFSEAFAESELKRYAYIMPAQAPSYYYGYKVLKNLKEELKSRLKDKFTEKCFNDALLDLGVLPLKVISGRLGNLSCGSKQAAFADHETSSYSNRRGW